jgi:hypothetical protein
MNEASLLFYHIVLGCCRHGRKSKIATKDPPEKMRAESPILVFHVEEFWRREVSRASPGTNK